MKKILVISLMFAFALLVGCSNNVPESEPAAANAATAQPEETKAPEQKLTEAEQLALDYVKIYINGTDLEANEKFVEDNVHPDAKPLFELGTGITEKSDDVKNPVVKGSTDYDFPEVKGMATLIAGDGGAEIIVLTLENKVVMAYSPNDTTEEAKNTFAELKTKIVNE